MPSHRVLAVMRGEKEEALALTFDGGDDELAEFRRNVLEVLRQPIEEGVVRISRSLAETVYPARVQLVLALTNYFLR